MWKGTDRVANWVRTIRSSNVRSIFTSRYGAAQKAAVKPGFLYEFPWESLGGAKYVLYLPFLYIIAAGLDDSDNFAFHMMMLVALRYLQVRLFPPCIGALGPVPTPCAKNKAFTFTNRRNSPRCFPDENDEPPCPSSFNPAHATSLVSLFGEGGQITSRLHHGICPAEDISD